MEGTDYVFTVAFVAPNGRARMIDVFVPKDDVELTDLDFCAKYMLNALAKLREQL